MSYIILHQIQHELTTKYNDILNRGKESQYYSNRAEIRSKLSKVTQKIKDIDRYIKTYNPKETMDYLHGSEEK